MWLVLGGTNDPAVLWAYQGLKLRGLTPLELITTEMLNRVQYWEHHLGEDGVTLSIVLADGRCIHSQSVRGVLNRLMAVPSVPLMLARPSDRDYVSQELTAFFMSWLYALPQPVLNRPTAQGLSGAWRHISEWVWLASQAGLPVPNYKQSSHDLIDEMTTERRLTPLGTPIKTVIVAGGHVTNVGMPAHIVESCRRLAQLADTELLGIDFATNAISPWLFVNATPWPDLTLGGEELLNILMTVLRDGGEEH